MTPFVEQATHPIKPTFEPFVDPIVAEVWAIKAQLNREANYDLREIMRRANLTTIESALACLHLPSDERSLAMFGPTPPYPNVKLAVP
jgi:hypothetical protein